MRGERPDMGRVGVWSGHFSAMPAALLREVVPRIEGLGFRTVWFPEAFAKEAFAHASLLLTASDRVVVASGIANIWARDPTAMINGGRTLAEAFPGRFVLGIGVSHAPSAARRGGDYDRPLTLMKDYLDAMDGARYYGPEPPDDPPVLLAALGPKMLELAATRTVGAHPYFVPVEHTVLARGVMGPDAFLAPEQAVVLASDADEARAIARRHTAYYLVFDNYRNNLLRLGWSAQDLADDGSDDLVDAVVAWGDVATIQQRVAAHFAAGADHVGVQVLNATPKKFPHAELAELAPALLEL
jgi:probable F420-dependent oxidoreductase